LSFIGEVFASFKTVLVMTPWPMSSMRYSVKTDSWEMRGMSEKYREHAAVLFDGVTCKNIISGGVIDGKTVKTVICTDDGGSTFLYLYLLTCRKEKSIIT
jgi:hypothetical protein